MFVLGKDMERTFKGHQSTDGSSRCTGGLRNEYIQHVTIKGQLWSTSTLVMLELTPGYTFRSIGHRVCEHVKNIQKSVSLKEDSH